jgi:hypothetical protein
MPTAWVKSVAGPRSWVFRRRVLIGTLKCDYLGDTDLRDAETATAHLGGWFDYNTQALRSAQDAELTEYRADATLSSLG